jgi:hypothetical protein
MADNEKHLRLYERSPGDNWRVIVEIVGTQKLLDEPTALELEYQLMQEQGTQAGNVALRGIGYEAGDYLLDFRVAHSGDNFGALDATLAEVDEIIKSHGLLADVRHAGMAPESEIRPEMSTNQAWQYTSDVTPEALDMLAAHRERVMDDVVKHAASIMDAELAQLLDESS